MWRSTHIQLSQSHEPSDAMVNVDDMVPNLEVAKIGKERRGHRLSPVANPSLFIEEVGLRVHLQPSIGKSKPPATTDR